LNQLLAFEIDGYQFGLHLQFVERVVQAVEIQPVPDFPEMMAGVINVQGSIMPVLNTRKRLGLKERPLKLSDLFVIALADNHPIALIVDSVQGIIPYASDQLVQLEEMSPNRAASDVLRIADGLLLVYNPDKSLSPSEWSTLAIALEQAGKAHDQRN
jgi:purine-binding chemotaxis protein CheW